MYESSFAIDDSSNAEVSHNHTPCSPPRAGPSSSTTSSNSKSIPTLRLLVLRTDVLPREHNLAVLDGYEQIQLGRDAPAPGNSATPKVRLKELEVSKLHATLFWDNIRREWAIVDMGSKHGTYLRRGVGRAGGSVAVADASPAPLSDGSGADPRGQRLSPPRVSSIPRSLLHLDELSIGSTTFIVHVHDDRVPCVECSPQGPDNEIPLFHDKTITRVPKRKFEPDIAPTALQSGRDPKKALSMLKRNLLSRHNSLTSTNVIPREDKSPTGYVDRSAKRRALHAHTGADAPGIDVRRIASTVASTSAQSTAPSSTTPSPPVSAPLTPLPSSNIGHKLLMKQGWVPGTSLGSSPAAETKDEVGGGIALVEPLDVAPRSNRAGLGVPVSAQLSIPVFPDMSWQEQGKLRRWKEHNTANS